MEIFPIIFSSGVRGDEVDDAARRESWLISRGVRVRAFPNVRDYLTYLRYLPTFSKLGKSIARVLEGCIRATKTTAALVYLY
jgi:hypothetical protein